MQAILEREETEEEKAKRYEEKDELFDIDENSVRQAKSTFISRCVKQALTGNHQKNLKYSGTANVEKIFGIRFPFYSVSFKYRGENCQAQAIASSKLLVHTKYPQAKEKAERTKMLKKKRMPFLFGAIGCFALGVLFLSLVQFATWLEVFGSLAIFGCAAYLLLFFLMKKKLLDKIVRKRLLIKKELLVKELAKRGYAPLTPRRRKEVLTLFLRRPYACGGVRSPCLTLCKLYKEAHLAGRAESWPKPARTHIPSRSIPRPSHEAHLSAYFKLTYRC